MAAGRLLRLFVADGELISALELSTQRHFTEIIALMISIDYHDIKKMRVS